METALSRHCIAEQTSTPPHGKKPPPVLPKEATSNIIFVESHTPNQSELQKIGLDLFQAAASQDARRTHVFLKARGVLEGSGSVLRQRSQHEL